MKKSQHVIPDPNGGWKVIKSGSDRASKLFDCKAPAVHYARSLSKKHKTDLYIHKKDGSVDHRSTYSVKSSKPKSRRSS